MEKRISVLYPGSEIVEYKTLSETTLHDLGLDTIIQYVSQNESERRLIQDVISKMTDDPNVAEYRSEVFEDILKLPEMRNRMMELLKGVRFIKEYGSFKQSYSNRAGIWDLLHRLEEVSDYIKSIEAIHECLSAADISSKGLTNLREYIDEIYREACFKEMKKDIEALKADTSNLRSVTLGINLNERFEADGMGLISVNNTLFKNSGIVSNFTAALESKSGITNGNKWTGDMHFHLLDYSSIAVLPENDGSEDVTHCMDRIVSQMLGTLVRRLRNVLSKYVSVTITDVSELIPEFVYYIRWAEYLEKLMANGKSFCRSTVINRSSPDITMKAVGIYNLKLANVTLSEDETIITNNLDFDKNHTLYILTGANRGGKTTITQAIGILFALAQGGIYVPGDHFEYVPVDNIFTHFPADEDKTIDLGRLGEECTRFKEIYNACTGNSLLLLNESFSTTSFEEGYYIAKDLIRAILDKNARTIYNTHMHKLAFDIAELNNCGYDGKAASLIVKSTGGKRSYKVEVAPPEGNSYAHDIAVKYGVTLEMLTRNK